MISGEILDERRDYPFGYVPLDVGENSQDPECLDYIGRTLSEGYAEGRRSLHAHFRVGSEGDHQPRDYCAIFKRLGEELDSPSVARGSRENGELMGRGYREMRKLVLVAIGEHTEQPEGVSGYRYVPSVVRLQSLDECPGVGMYTPDLGPTVFVKPNLICENGETGVVGDAFGHLGTLVCDGEFVGEVVEGASEVVEEVPDDGGENDGRRLEDFGPHELVAALDVRLGPHSTRISLTLDSLLRLYALQVFGGSV